MNTTLPEDVPMIAKTGVTIVLSLMLTLAGCKPSIDTKKESGGLMEIDRAFSRKSVSAGSAAAFRIYLDADALELPAGAEPIMGRDRICREMEETAAGTKLEWEPKGADVAAGGDLGYTWGTYTLSFRDKNDSLIVRYGKYLTIWKKGKDGDWKAVVDMGNQNPPPGPG